jgi:ketosteroid isomerase-like protein
MLRTAVLLLLLGISPILLADDVADLEAAAQARVKASNARDANAVAALSTPDVMLMDSGLASAGATPGGQMTTVTKEAVVAGDVAWRIGAYTRTSRTGTVVSRGQSLEIWKRSNGQWKLHRQMSSNILRPVPVPLPADPVRDTPN